MAQEVLLPNTSHWQSFDFSFIGTSDNSKLKPPKQLACARCYAQKLRCVRQIDVDDGCERCISANVECVNRSPHRMGRPTDNGTGGNQNTRRRTANNFNTRLSRQNRKSMGLATANVSPVQDTTSATLPMVSYGAPGLETWPWPSPQESTAVESISLTLPTTDESSTSSPSARLASLASSRTADGAAPIYPLPNLDDLFPGPFDLNCLPDQGQLSAEKDVHDPIELLTRLHLELYQCLSTVKNVEKAKKERLNCTSAEPPRDINTTWSERVFQTAERFIDALSSYIDSGPSSDTSSLTDMMDEDHDLGKPFQVDTATGLMIVSCYTRLLQIFEVVTFVVETFRDLDCPGSYVQISFGNFQPKANKALHARVLGQYVLVLLDGISEAVGRAVASSQLYAQAIASIRSDETELKKRIGCVISTSGHFHA